jgi:hypothetical protein
MTELERALFALGRELDLPPAPDLVPAVRARLERRTHRRRALVLVFAAAVVAIGIAFAVPPARTAILRFFDIGSVHVERVNTLPKATHESLTAGLGAPLVREDAEMAAGFSAHLGALTPGARWWARKGLLATVLPRRPPVLLIELTGDQVGIVKKFMTGGVHPTSVRGQFALWITGPHVFRYTRTNRLVEVTRYSGNALVWERNGITYRLEGEPSLAAALRNARRITR